MFIYLDLLLPTGSSDLPETDGPPYASFWSCFEWGLHMPHRLPCMRWSLKPPFHPYQHTLAVYFCCTILGVASTGRYPAFCPVKPGLSSPCPQITEGKPRTFVLLIRSFYHILNSKTTATNKFSQNRIIWNQVAVYSHKVIKELQ